MRRGVCPLCEREGEIVESHISFPKWLFKRVGMENPSGQFISLHDGVAMQSCDNETQHLLCKACESRFSKWEGYVALVSRQHDGAFPVLSRMTWGPPDLPAEVFEATDLDTNAMTLFALSIFWRRSVAGIEHAALGAETEGLLRRLLLGEVELPPGLDVFCWVQRPTGNPLEFANTHFAITETAPGVRCALFKMAGLGFMLLLGQPTAKIRMDLWMGRRVILCEQPGMMQYADHVVAHSQPKGKLAAKNPGWRAPEREYDGWQGRGLNNG